MCTYPSSTTRRPLCHLAAVLGLTLLVGLDSVRSELGVQCSAGCEESLKYCIETHVCVGGKTVEGFRDRCLIPKHLAEFCCEPDTSVSPTANLPAIACDLSTAFTYTWVPNYAQAFPGVTPGAASEQGCKNDLKKQYGDAAEKFLCPRSYCAAYMTNIASALQLTKGRVPTEADRCKEDGSKFCRPGIGPATAHSMPIDRFVCSSRNGGSGSGGKPAGTLRRLLEADKGGDKDDGGDGMGLLQISKGEFPACFCEFLRLLSGESAIADTPPSS